MPGLPWVANFRIDAFPQVRSIQTFMNTARLWNRQGLTHVNRQAIGPLIAIAGVLVAVVSLIAGTGNWWFLLMLLCLWGPVNLLREIRRRN